ncbi:MAG: phage holin family protein [Naasia sp.]|jgi:high-affinity Fe2+/Pb2+ permease|uniref:phage holin family protein n=1 Tax=Naasia sp. TaxID=2546198 RepID=UPI0026209FBE|nr:phage holin family protein [Naasia sp.]MCU1570226.1 phage holin family protein [Naasia sp.]
MPSVRVEPQTDRKSLLQLIADVPGLVGQLIRDEIEQIKKEVTGKLTELGIGVGFFAGAAFFGFFLFAVLLTAAILGLAVVFPGWLAALMVAFVLLVIVVVLVLLGMKRVKKGVPPTPEDSIESVKNDVRAFKGMGKYDR